MDIACIQLSVPDDEPRDARLDRVLGLIDRAADADLVVLPELWPTGYFAFDRYEDESEPMSGPTITALRQRAADHRIHLMAGSFVENRQGDLANCAVTIGPDGEVIHTYRKVHLFGYESQESQLLTPGTGATAVETPLGALATTTCYDLRFPELYRLLVDAGAKIIVVPAAWPLARLHHWRLFVQARAVEDQVLLVACNGAGVQSGVALGGHSMVVDAWGEILAEAGEDEEILRVTVDVGAIERVRTEFPVLEHRRIPIGDPA